MPCPQGEDVCKLLKDYALEGGKETCRRKVNERTCSSAIPQSSNLCIGGDQGSGLGGDIGSSGIGARARAAVHHRGRREAGGRDGRGAGHPREAPGGV